MSDDLEVHVEALSTRFASADERWVRQVRGLWRELGSAGVAQQRSIPVPGTKGVLDAAVLSLGSAGAVTAAVELLKGWLDRDASRRVRVSFGESGGLETIELAGRDLTAEALRRVTDAMTARLE